MKKHLLMWLLQIAVAVMFLTAGWPKLAGAPLMVQTFDAIGIGQWLRYLTGALEIGGAVLLFVPALAALGALTLAIVMVGAILTHAFVLGGSAIPAMVLLGASLTITWLRRGRFGVLARA